MKAEIKRLHSPDVENFQNYHPQDIDNFCLLLQIMVGIKDQEGEESFDLILCTPKWLLINHKQDDVFFGLHYLIVFEYNYNRILQKLEQYINTLDEPDWTALGIKIGKIARWEFDDYRE